MTYSAIKQNKRLVIVDETGKVVWSPPDWIRHRIQSRESVVELAQAMGLAERPIDAIIAFETKHNPKVKGKNR